MCIEQWALTVITLLRVFFVLITAARLMAITLSYGKWRNSTPHIIKTPSLVDMKFIVNIMVTSERYAPKSVFVKIRAAGASGESVEI